jgi:hypothetical protein
MLIAVYIALALTFYVVATGLSAILRPFAPPRLQAALVAMMTAGSWAPVRWWDDAQGSDSLLGGWHPLIGNWLLNEPANRPAYTVISFVLTALLAYVLIRRWQRRNEPHLRSIH